MSHYPTGLNCKILVKSDDNFSHAATLAPVYARCERVSEGSCIASNAVLNTVSIGGSPANNGLKMTEIK